MHVILRNLLFTTHCRSVGYILRQKYTRLSQFLAFTRTVGYESEAKSFIMLSNLIVALQKVILLKMEALNALHSSSLSSDSLLQVRPCGSCMLHRLPCSSIPLCKQVLCCCRSNFASRQPYCTCTSSSREGFQVLVLL